MPEVREADLMRAELLDANIYEEHGSLSDNQITEMLFLWLGWGRMMVDDSWLKPGRRGRLGEWAGGLGALQPGGSRPKLGMGPLQVVGLEPRAMNHKASA